MLFRFKSQTNMTADLSVKIRFCLNPHLMQVENPHLIAPYKWTKRLKCFLRFKNAQRFDLNLHNRCVCDRHTVDVCLYAYVYASIHLVDRSGIKKFNYLILFPVKFHSIFFCLSFSYR